MSVIIIFSVRSIPWQFFLLCLSWSCLWVSMQLLWLCVCVHVGIIGAHFYMYTPILLFQTTLLLYHLSTKYRPLPSAKKGGVLTCFVALYVGVNVTKGLISSLPCCYTLFIALQYVVWHFDIPYMYLTQWLSLTSWHNQPNVNIRKIASQFSCN